MGQKRKRPDDSNSAPRVSYMFNLPQEPNSEQCKPQTRSVTRRSQQSPPSQTPQPLTHKNLLILQNATRHTQTLHNLSIPHHSSNADSIPESRSPKRHAIHDDREKLETHNIFIESFSALALAILDEGSHSAMTTEKQLKFLKRREDHSLRNEPIFTMACWELIIGKKRCIGLEGEDTLPVRSWSEDGLDYNVIQSSDTRCMPKPDTSSNIPRFTYKYARLYGVNLPVFKEDAQTIIRWLDLRLLPQLSEDLRFPFMSVHLKSCAGTIEDATHQAGRAGAAIVHYMQRLKDIAGCLDDAHAKDDGSFCFSLAMTPEDARLFVHWADPPGKGGATFHMHNLRHYSLLTGETVAQLKNDVGNVLEWGVGRRKRYLIGLMPAIEKYLDGIVGRSQYRKSARASALLLDGEEVFGVADEES